ncbi:MAG: hypothetical protein KDB27_28135 [Planctomycetales bacterium]|nr:hypothetical protein [Planctomycetales bacterium]
MASKTLATRAGDLAAPAAFGQLERMREEIDDLLDRFYRGGSWDAPDQWDNGWGCDVEKTEKEIVVACDAFAFECTRRQFEGLSALLRQLAASQHGRCRMQHATWAVRFQQ